jgi:hypothetical protein
MWSINAWIILLVSFLSYLGVGGQVQMVGDYSERKKLSASERVPRLDEFQVRLFRSKSLDKDALNREHPVLGFKAGSGAVLSFSASKKKPWENLPLTLGD